VAYILEISKLLFLAHGHCHHQALLDRLAKVSLEIGFDVFYPVYYEIK
jgi:hypothetical protein